MSHQILLMVVYKDAQITVWITLHIYQVSMQLEINFIYYSKINLQN